MEQGLCCPPQVCGGQQKPCSLHARELTPLNLISYSSYILFHLRARPLARGQHHTIGQGKLLTRLEDVLLVEHERTAHTGIWIVAHKPFRRKTRIAGLVNKDERRIFTVPIVPATEGQPGRDLAHDLGPFQRPGSENPPMKK